MTTATVQIGSARQLDVVDSFDPLVPYNHPVMMSHNNIVYGSLQDVPLGKDPSDPANSAYWEVLMKGGMQWKGEYQSQVYNQYEAVQYQGGVYIVIEGETTTATETPTVATGKWDVLLEAPSLDGTPNTMLIRDGSGTGIELPLTPGILKSNGTSGTTAFVASNPPITNTVELIGGVKNGSGVQDGMGGAVLKNGSIYTWGYQTSNMYGRSRNSGHAPFPQIVPMVGATMGIVSATSSSYLNAGVTDGGEIYIQHSTNSQGTAGGGFNGAGAIDKNPIRVMREAKPPATLIGSPAKIFGANGGSYSNAGYDSLFVLTSEGEVISVGYNGYGQLGLGDTTARNEFEKITFPEKIVDISVGDARYMHVMFLGESGHVYFTGYCHGGRKGDSNNATVTSPQRDDALTAPPWGTSKVIAIQAKGTSSNGASVVLCDNGKRYATGYNSHGTIGNASTGAKAVWTADVHSDASADYVQMVNTGNVYGASWAKDTNDAWWGWGTGYGNGSTSGTASSPVKMTAIPSGIIEVFPVCNASGYANTFFACGNAEVYACGNGSQFIHGNGLTTSTFTPIPIAVPQDFGHLVDVAHSGYSSNPSVVLLGSNGKLYGSGYNGHAQLGNGNTANCYTFAIDVKV